MSGHIAELVADYLEGRLDGERVREVETHLAACAECAADVRWARDFRDAAAAQGLRHPGADRMIELADGRGDPPSELEESHLASCAACRREIAWARSAAKREDAALEAEARVGERRQPKTRWAWWRRGLLGYSAAVLAAAAAVFLLFTLPGNHESAIVGLAVIEPLQVRITRGPVEPGTFEESRMQGLEAYEARDYERARDALRRAAMLEPGDGEVALYLGSAELLLGEAREAAEALRGAVKSAAGSIVRDEALWQLANAELAGGRAREAAAALEQLARKSGRRREDASDLLRRLQAADR